MDTFTLQDTASTAGALAGASEAEEGGALPASTITTSLRQLTQACRDLDAVYMALVSTNAFADRPRPELDRAFDVIVAALGDRVDVWGAAHFETIANV